MLALPLAVARRRPLRARFVERLNRFVARVEVAGAGETLAHVPNTGRLTGTLVPGCPVLLDGPFPARRCGWTLVAAREGRTWVGTVTTYANRLFPLLWQAGIFPELRGRTLRAEVAHGRSRFDFRVGAAWVEVKSVTLAAAGAARFPDAVTARGARHCRELAAFGRRAAIVFMAQRGDVERIEPEDDVDPEFGAAIRAAAVAGVRVLGCAVELGPEGCRRARRVPVRLGVRS